MKKILFFIFMVLSFTIYCKENFYAKDGVIDLSEWDLSSKKLIPLKGEWEFLWNEQTSHQDFVDNISKVKIVKVPNSWTDYDIDELKRVRGASGYATYRLKLILPKENKIYGLRVNGILFSYNLFLNDKLLFKGGEFSQKSSEILEFLQPKVLFFYAENKENHLIIQVACTANDKGGIWENILIGNETDITNDRIEKIGYDFLVFGGLLLLSIYHFIIFFYRRREHSNIYLALLYFFIGLRIITVNEKVIFLMFPDLTYNLEIKLEFLSIVLASLFVLLFVYSQFKKYFNVYIFKTLILLNLAYTLMIIFGNYYIFNYTTGLLVTLLLVENIYILCTSFLAAYKKEEGAKVIILGLFIVLIGVLFDGRRVLGILSTRQIVPLCILIFSILQAAIVANKIYRTFFQVEFLSEKLHEKNLALKKLTSSLEDTNQRLEYMNDNLEENVRKRTRELNLSKVKIKQLLDNSDQGFLYFTSNLIVKSDYSIKCKNIFEKEITGEYFPNLVYNDDDLNLENLEKILKRISNIKVKKQQDRYIPLLPETENINGKRINFTYKIIPENELTNSQSIMVILNDTTEEVKLKNKIIEEKNNLKMILEVFRNYNDFKNTVLSYKYFVTTKISNQNSTFMDSEKGMLDILRNIHSFKGDFAQLNMIKTTEKLHDIENQITDFCKNFNIKKPISEFLIKSDLLSFFKEDLEILKSDLGDDLLDKDQVNFIKVENVEKLENNISKYLYGDDKNYVIKEIRKLKFKELREFFVGYNNYLFEISKNIDKSIDKLKFSGEKIYLNFQKYNELIKSFSHIFRNMVDHGIETEEERVYLGKAPYGKININTKMKNQEIIIRISDDGRGIDIEKIKQKAVNKGMISREKVNRLSRKETLNFIFMDTITTKESVSRTSGRGVGLSAVKSTIEKYRGSISTTTRDGKGTTFIIKIPFDENNCSI